MSTDILPIPKVPEGLRESWQLGTLVPFVGAGVSLIAGCPNWTSLANGALLQIASHGKLNRAHIEQLKLLTPRVRLSIASVFAEEQKAPIDYQAILQAEKWRENKNGRRIYLALAKLSNRFVTTNYDEWLDTVPSQLEVDESSSSAASLARSRFYRVNDFTPANLSLKDSVIHLHGSVVDFKSMVVTTQDYVRHYAHDVKGAENRVLTFLDHLFSKKSVLFIGYGLEELEILEYVILKAKQIVASPPGESRHYLLQGFFSHELELFKSLEKYYREQCGIVLLPFLRDEKDWGQLIDVIEDFAVKLPASDPLVLEDFEEMKSLLNG